MTVDLEEEQDPPSFKEARKKDKERLQRFMEEEAETITELQRDIEMQLEKNRSRKRKRTATNEENDVDKFIKESTLGTVNKILKEELGTSIPADEAERELG
ncbi:hypothetical protein AMK59_742, partial [Oryctes borbonicus]